MKELCSDPDFKPSLSRDHSKRVRSNALDGSEDDAIYGNEMLEVADDDMEDEFETDFKKTMMTKHYFNFMKFSVGNLCLLTIAQLIVE